MRKAAIILTLTLIAVIALMACGKDFVAPTNVDMPDRESTIATAAITEVFTESTIQAAASESAVQANAAASFSAGKTTRTTATSATQPATGKRQPVSTITTRTTTPTTQRTTTTARRTTTTTAAPRQTQPTKPVYSEADYAEIIAAVQAYTQSKTTVKFIWDTALTYEYARSGRAGYHDVVSLNQNGKDGVIKTLKYNVDLTEDVVSNPLYGVPSSQVNYNVVKVEYQGEPYFALIYG